MRKTDEDFKNEWKQLDESNIQQVCQYIQRHEINIQYYLADIIASLCNVQKDKILNLRNKELRYVHVRWLLWYAYRYMTAESYDNLSTNKIWSNADKTSIRYGVLKMGTMIEHEPFWARRWAIVKKIIDIRNAGEEPIDNTIVITIPRDIKNKVNIQIKNKE